MVCAPDFENQCSSHIIIPMSTVTTYYPTYVTTIHHRRVPDYLCSTNRSINQSPRTRPKWLSTGYLAVAVLSCLAHRDDCDTLLDNDYRPPGNLQSPSPQMKGELTAQVHSSTYSAFTSSIRETLTNGQPPGSLLRGFCCVSGGPPVAISHSDTNR